MTTILPVGFKPKKGLYVTFDSTADEDFSAATVVYDQTIPPAQQWPMVTMPCSTSFVGQYAQFVNGRAREAITALVLDTPLYNGLIDLLSCSTTASVEIGVGTSSSCKIGKLTPDVSQLNPALVPGCKSPRLASFFKSKFFSSSYASVRKKISDQQAWTTDEIEKYDRFALAYISYLFESQSASNGCKSLASIRSAVFKSLMPVSGPTKAGSGLTVNLNTQNTVLKTALVTDEYLAIFIKAWLRWWALNNLTKKTVTKDGVTVTYNEIEEGSVQDIILNGADGQGGEFTVSIPGGGDLQVTPGQSEDSTLIPEEYSVSGAESVEQLNDITHDTDATLALPKVDDTLELSWVTASDIYPAITVSGAVAQGYKMYNRYKPEELVGFTPLSETEAANAEGINKNRPEKTQYETKNMREKKKGESLSAPVVEVGFPEKSWELLWSAHVADTLAKVKAILTESNAKTFKVKDQVSGTYIQVYSVDTIAFDTAYVMPIVSDAKLESTLEGAAQFDNFAIPDSFAIPSDSSKPCAMETVRIMSKTVTYPVAGAAYKKAHDGAVEEYVRRLKNSNVNEDPDAKGFPWWIFGAVGAVALLGVIIAVAVSNKDDKEGRESPEGRFRN